MEVPFVATDQPWNFSSVSLRDGLNISFGKGGGVCVARWWAVANQRNHLCWSRVEGRRSERLCKTSPPSPLEADEWDEGQWTTFVLRLMNICYGVEAHLNALRPVHSPLIVHMAVAICMWDLSSLMSELKFHFCGTLCWRLFGFGCFYVCADAEKATILQAPFSALWLGLSYSTFR